MSNNLTKQIYDNLNLKETDELIEIWRTNDHFEWTDFAFNAIREILQKRIGELPPQNEPVLEHVANDHDDEVDDDKILDKYNDQENAPVFYKPQEVLLLKTWLYRAAIASIIATAIAGLLELPTMQRTILSYFAGGTQWNVLVWIIAIVVDVFAVGLQGAIYYFGFKTLGIILTILMETEFNSRGVK
jgi:hypothetical protein